MAVQRATEASLIPDVAPIGDHAPRHGTSPGFRHFLFTPDASQRFKAYGIDPLDAAEHLPKIRGLMNRLSRRMDAEFSSPAVKHWVDFFKRPSKRGFCRFRTGGRRNDSESSDN